MYLATVAKQTDYFLFGMIMDQRSTSTAGYRYGYNGKENDDDVKGEGNQQDYGFRIYDPRVARFLSVDPLAPDYPWYTPYQFAGNTPIQAIDLDGLEEFYTADGSLLGKYGTSTEIRIVHAGFESNARSLVSGSSEEPVLELALLMGRNGFHGVFSSTTEAAVDWANKYNPLSISDNREYGSFMYELQIGGQSVQTYTEPTIGDGSSVNIR